MKSLEQQFHDHADKCHRQIEFDRPDLAARHALDAAEVCASLLGVARDVSDIKRWRDNGDAWLKKAKHLISEMKKERENA